MFRFPIGGGAELRLLEPRHVEALYELAIEHRDHLRAWLPWAHADYTLEDTRAFVLRSLEAYVRTGAVTAGVWFRDTLVGVIGLDEVNRRDRSTGMMLWISEDYQGRGLMRSAFRAMIDFAFDELELHRIEIRCATGNARSRSFPEKTGFTHEGTLRQAQRLGDRYVDLEVYSLLAPEWRANAGARS